MRYAIILKGISLSQIEANLKSIGGQNIKSKPAMKQIFCDLDPDQLTTLSKIGGIKVKEVKKVSGGQRITTPYEEFIYPQIATPRTEIVHPEISTPHVEFAQPRKSIPQAEAIQPQSVGLNLYEVYHDLREAYTPPLDGAGLTVAVLDSGIRGTHEALEGKVVHSANFSESPTSDDRFGHGTGVGYIIAGEKDARSGVATGAKLMNIKVLNDNGEATDEIIVDGIDAVCALVASARAHGLPITDPMYPNTINLSAGGEDDGDPDNPMRVAARTAWEEYGLQIIAAAGNAGPDLSTVMCPACDPSVIAVGALKSWEFVISSISSRGPTIEGLVKPDLVCWGEGIEVASHKADDKYESKSGTSFSTPILVGADGIIWDLTRRVYGEGVRVTYHDWLQYAYAYCVKPDVAPVEKDNTYGHGMPAIGSMVQQVLRPVSPLSGITEAAVPLMGIGLLGMVMTGMMK